MLRPWKKHLFFTARLHFVTVFVNNLSRKTFLLEACSQQGRHLMQYFLVVSFRGKPLIYKKTRIKWLNFCVISLHYFPLPRAFNWFLITCPCRYIWYLFISFMLSAANQSAVLVYVTPQKTCQKQVLLPCEVHLNKIQLFWIHWMQ